MQHTLTELIEIEIKDRTAVYREMVARREMDRDTANHRLGLLRSALRIAQGQPDTYNELELRTEITRWMTRLQRNSTVNTMHYDGRVVQMLSELLEQMKPIQRNLVQTRLL